MSSCPLIIIAIITIIIITLEIYPNSKLKVCKIVFSNTGNMLYNRPLEFIYVVEIKLCTL